VRPRKRPSQPRDRSVREPIDVERLLVQIRDGSELERADALRLLSEQAAGSDDRGAWHLYALGLGEAGQFQDAIHILDQLVESLSDSPERDLYRFNLAATLTKAEQQELALYHLRYLGEHGSSETMRDESLDEVLQLEEWQRTVEEDRRFQHLRADRLRERVTSGPADQDDFLQLARSLLKLAGGDTGPSYLDEAISVLEDGRRRFPASVELLEHLTHAYLKADSDRLEATLQELERIAPDSPILDDIRQAVPDEAWFRDEMLHRTGVLLSQAASPDRELAAAAIADLEQIVRQFPANPNYRSAYAMALAMTGRHSEALRQAERLEAEPIDTHGLHLTLGQVFAAVGHRERAKQHFQLALELTESEEERDDTTRLLEQWGLA
jgi:tetratricopeptide (TPR) repeat protein